MSKIQEQIKVLQAKQKKIEYISYIADIIKNDTKCIDFKDVKADVFSKIEPFLNELKIAIENGTEVKTHGSDEVLTSEQLDALKLVADRFINKSSVVPPNNGAFNQESSQSASKPKQELNHNDKMNFAMTNRHLANKRVQVLNDQNAQIFGLVVGLDAPFVLIKTETGPTIQVPLEKVVPL